jgi:hypothetical protein
MTNGLQSLQTGFHCLHHALALPAAFGSVPGAALEALVKRATRSGDIRKDIKPFDLLRALIGVANLASSPDWQQSAQRLVDILIAGSRPSHVRR